MSRTANLHTVAAGFAVLTTFAILTGINVLATQAHTEALAQSTISAPAQVAVQAKPAANS